jgi:hypothetical protein
MVRRMKLPRLDLAHTTIIGVDNHLKCVQDELQKIVYIFVHVLDVERHCHIETTGSEERVLSERQPLQRLDNRDLEPILGSRRRIIHVSMSEMGDSRPLLDLGLAFDHDVELLGCSIGGRGQDCDGISNKLLIDGVPACHFVVLVVGSRLWELDGNPSETETSMK